MDRDWVATCWSLSVWMLGAPALGLLALLLPDGPRQDVAALTLTACASLALALLDLRRCGWEVPSRSRVAAAVALAGVVVAGLLVADARGDDRDVVLVLVGLGLPHVALAALAWPGWSGLVQRVAVATALVGIVGVLAFGVGSAVVLLSYSMGSPDDGAVGIGLAFALGQLLVLVGGTVIARPVALRRTAPRVPALA